MTRRPAVALDLRDHCPERVGVCLKQQRALLCVLAAEIDQDAAFDGADGLIAQRTEGVQYPFGGLFGEAGGAVDAKKLDRLFDGVICIFLIHRAISFICIFFMITPPEGNYNRLSGPGSAPRRRKRAQARSLSASGGSTALHRCSPAAR